MMKLTRILFGLFVIFAVTDLSAEELIPTRSLKHAVDLSYALNSKNAYWPGENYYPFQLRTLATLEKDGVLSKAFRMPEHLGTHIDAPNHFEPNQPSVDQIPLVDLIGLGVVLDISLKAEANADAMLTVEDIHQWERQHGEIPQRAIVLLNTGWGRFWENPTRYQNRDSRGELHFPSYSPEAAEFLVNERSVLGIGVDNMSIDRGISKKFQVHHIVNKAGKFGLENVARLQNLPPKGFTLIVAPIKLETGTGGPTRIWAVLDDPPSE
ncbi:cyclase family protein [Thalassoroseus pseudoceratinae]|uniref:cyclase family protein n=1 Tax=Thalassoroseus pseudoceratinae TaxID=2713176 RepID=UPI00197E6796|nr:cyclase family protein [Thalassoroseus pseudoceratinae]